MDNGFELSRNKCSFDERIAKEEWCVGGFRHFRGVIKQSTSRRVDSSVLDEDREEGAKGLMVVVASSIATMTVVWQPLDCAKNEGMAMNDIRLCDQVLQVILYVETGLKRKQKET